VEREGFHEIAKNSWNNQTLDKFDIDKWKEKTRILRRHIKGWHINVEKAYKKDKKILLEKLDVLDKKSEENLLSVEEKELQVSLIARMKTLLRDEELKWR
jgi:hypothetical protein